MTKQKPTRKPWSEKEIALIVEDYFAMRAKEQRGETYSKAAHRRELLKKLDGRSNASVEFKHQNISAACEAMGIEIVKGYKPRGHFQKSLSGAISKAVSAMPRGSKIVSRRNAGKLCPLSNSTR